MKIENQTFFSWWKENSDSYGALFFDIDGTLSSGRADLPGSKKLLAELDKVKFPYLLLTNDGNHSVQEKCEILTKSGLIIAKEKIISCSMALKVFFEKHNCQGKTFFVMGELGNPCYAETAGTVVERDPRKIMSCEGVIIGEGTYNWQDNFSAVFNYFIKRPSAWLLVPNPDSYWPNGSSGEIGIGAGGKARFISSILKEYGYLIKPVYFGKPYPLIFQFAKRRLHELFPQTERIKKREIIILGDSLRSDIKGGKAFGIKTALVLTGITNETHLKKIAKNLQPDFVFSSLG
jgi:HAD superfamily hydrolase (TIGR01450 family)